MIDTASVVYFAQADYGGPIKIGNTWHHDRRLAAVAKDLPFNLVPIGQFSGERFSERFVQCWFRKNRIKGEWFEPCPELMRWAYQARAHGRVHQVPAEPSRSFAVSARSLVYRLEEAGLTLDDLAAEASILRTTLKIQLDHEIVKSRTLLAAFAVAMARCGRVVNWHAWGGEYFPDLAKAAELDEAEEPVVYAPSQIETHGSTDA